MELTYQITLEHLRSRMNSALGLTEQRFSSGDACRVPSRRDDRPDELEGDGSRLHATCVGRWSYNRTVSRLFGAGPQRRAPRSG